MNTGFIEASVISWQDFKDKVAERSMCPQWYVNDRGQGSGNGQYRLYANDGYFLFNWILDQDGEADVIDFETNYKDNWNSKLEYRDANGLHRVHTSPRRENTTTYFTGAGDDGDIGSGVKMIFNLTADDSSKSKTLIFNEAVNIKDGMIVTKDAPLGSSIDVDILDPQGNVVLRFAKRVGLLGDNVIYLNSEDSEEIPIGLKMKITINNSDINNTENEAARSFKVVGNLEMYRGSTI